MIKLPLGIREQVSGQLDDYLEVSSDSTDPDSLARKVVVYIEQAAEEFDLDEAEDIIGNLESSGDLDSTLMDLLTEQLEELDLEEVTSEELMAMVEKACEIEWLDEDEIDELSFGGDEVEEVDEL